MTTAASVVRPNLDFSRAPGEVSAVATRDELRAVLLDDLVQGGAVWISVESLALADPRGQTRALKQVARFRTGVAGLNRNPHTAVLDWSTARGAGVDVLASYAIVAAAVGGRGATVVACEPRDSSVANALDVGQLASIGQARWVGETNLDAVSLGHVSLQRFARRRQRAFVPHLLREPRRLKILAPVLVLDPADRQKASELCGETLRALGDAAFVQSGSEDLSAIVTAVTREILANALGHAVAKRVVVAYGLDNRSGPRFDVVVGDDGLGIAGIIRERMGISVLEKVPERYFVGDLLRRVHQTSDGYGRGFVRGLRELTSIPGASVRIRSGAVAATVAESGVELTVLGAPSIGFGTLIQISVPLPSWKG